ncbi:MBL fold metallo-hydrolase [uncultured Jannaschia sp.]|uniref:MBL fold metallo-hydrolase n=1 Tax=uncultured Jannaschia sp. TaxID=293347 RepID=UPI00260A89EA|nr:MBL fold metallo-hydrolase [uncultured Jannaschia sp.]
MTQTRRTFLATVAATGTITVLPFSARAEAHDADVFRTGAGPITVHPVSHASFVMETPAGVIYADPVGGAAQYEDLPPPDLILITHEHGDHYDEETLSDLIGDDTRIIANPAVYGMLSENLRARAEEMANGDETSFSDVGIQAIPAYNTTEARLEFHPEGRDNGYVLAFEDFRIYISGDTEDTPEMRALENIDLAFLCMNLPFTMDAEQAASAVQEFTPTYVYPYHYHGRDGGTQDPAEFAQLAGDATEVRTDDWYKPDELG